MPLFSKNHYVLEGFLTTCSFDYINRDFHSRIYHIILFGFGFVFPFSIFIVFYTLTYKALKSKGNFIRQNTDNGLELEQMKQKSHNSLLKNKQNRKNDEEMNNSGSGKNRLNLYYTIRKREIKLTKIIRINFTFFCIAWIPYAIVTIYAQFGPNSKHFITPWTTSIPALTAKLSSVYNPIIYVVTSQDCKKYIFDKFTKT